VIDGCCCFFSFFLVQKLFGRRRTTADNFLGAKVVWPTADNGGQGKREVALV
jgi:hypothetical protein